MRSKLFYDYMSRLFDTYSDKSERKSRENVVTSLTDDPIELEVTDNYYRDWKNFMIKLRDKKDKGNFLFALPYLTLPRNAEGDPIY